LFFGAEIPVVATITRATIHGNRFRCSYEAFCLEVTHACDDQMHRKSGYTYAGTQGYECHQRTGEIGKKRIERKKIRELLGKHVVDGLPRGFQVGQRIQFNVWAWLWSVPETRLFVPTMTIQEGGPRLTMPTRDFGGRDYAKIGRAAENRPGFLLVEHGPRSGLAGGLTIEYTADEIREALKGWEG
jgi:hypothetical protein